MPRKGTGSKKSYPNRSDMPAKQAIRVPDDAGTRPYGKRRELEGAQREFPLPRRAPVPAPQATPPPVAGELGQLTARSARPDEPITSGLDRGPGPGSDALLLSGRGLGRNTLLALATETGDPFLLDLALRTANG